MHIIGFPSINLDRDNLLKFSIKWLISLKRAKSANDVVATATFRVNRGIMRGFTPPRRHTCEIGDFLRDGLFLRNSLFSRYCNKLAHSPKCPNSMTNLYHWRGHFAFNRISIIYIATIYSNFNKMLNFVKTQIAQQCCRNRNFPWKSQHFAWIYAAAATSLRNWKILYEIGYFCEIHCFYDIVINLRVR